MKRLVKAFETLFSGAARSGGELSETAGFTLSNVDWAADLDSPDPVSNAVVRTYLEEACAGDRQRGSTAHSLAQALLPLADQLGWRMRAPDQERDADMIAFSRNFTAVTVIGRGGVLPSDEVTAGFSLQAPSTFYPPHAHHAEESYWIIGGSGDWKVDAEPWFAVEPGDPVYHESGAVHAMRTNANPLLSVWLWTSHLDSEVVIVRSHS